MGVSNVSHKMLKVHEAIAQWSRPNKNESDNDECGTLCYQIYQINILNASHTPYVNVICRMNKINFQLKINVETKI